MTGSLFSELIAEAESEPVVGWNFDWFEGRATEARPSWGYSKMLVQRVAAVSSVLDVQTGGGEVLAEVLSRVAHLPKNLAATESWSPNADIARRRLATFGVAVAEVPDETDLPFPSGQFDLVVSRHPTVTTWQEVARVLKPRGSYLSQQVGAGSNRELTEFLMGPQPQSDRRSPQRAVREAEEHGMEVLDVRQETLRTVFYDVGAVVYFLRKVIWTVPGFSVDAYRDRLLHMHEKMEREGPFVSHSQRFLIEARKPR